MTRQVSLKIAILLPIVYATWALTSSLMARQVDQEKTASLTEVLALASKPQVVDPTSTPVDMTYEYKLVGFDAQVQNREILVTSSVELTDRVGDRSYLWRLQAFEEGAREPTIDVPYKQQIFSVHPSGKMSPSFSERITLPKGTHRVALTLYALPKEFDLDKLADSEVAAALTALKINKTLIVE